MWWASVWHTRHRGQLPDAGSCPGGPAEASAVETARVGAGRAPGGTARKHAGQGSPPHAVRTLPRPHTPLGTLTYLVKLHPVVASSRASGRRTQEWGSVQLPKGAGPRVAAGASGPSVSWSQTQTGRVSSGQAMSSGHPKWPQRASGHTGTSKGQSWHFGDGIYYLTLLFDYNTKSRKSRRVHSKP